MLITLRLFRRNQKTKMFMKTQIKSYLAPLAVGAVALALLPQTNSAVPITGSISFNGNVTAFVNASGTGTIATDYSLAHSLVFSETLVSAGANGAFAGIPLNSAVDVFSPLGINQPSFPTPSGTPLWTTAFGGFKFLLTSLTEDPLVGPFDTMTLRGVGTISDGNPLDDNTGEWVATFTDATSAEGTTFSWNSSFHDDAPQPMLAVDNGSCCVLLGLGLISLRIFAHYRKKSDGI
jgi:hypothetical protein